MELAITLSSKEFIRGVMELGSSIIPALINELSYTYIQTIYTYMHEMYVDVHNYDNCVCREADMLFIGEL